MTFSNEQVLSLWSVLCFFLFSSYKRYFYCHDITGITRWDYPEGPETDDRPDEQLLSTDMDDPATLNTIELESSVPSSSNEVQHPDIQTEVFPGEPMPPGVDPPLPGPLSANILALAGCPPPPPPMTPPDTVAADDIGTDDGDEMTADLDQPSDLPVKSPMSDEEQLPGSAIPDPDPEVQETVVEISAPPVLNWPTSPPPLPSTNSGMVVETESSGEVNLPPTAEATATLSPTNGTSSTTPPAVDETTHQHRRRKKDKVL